MRKTSLKFLSAGILTMAFAVGCGDGKGPQLATVTGTVMMSGTPVPGVSVIFVPEDGGSPSYGGTNSKGAYRLLFNQNRAGAKIGRHSVLIENPEPVTDDSGKLIGEPRSLNVPKKYRQAGALTAAVSRGRNKLDFNLDTETRTASR